MIRAPLWSLRSLALCVLSVSCSPGDESPEPQANATTPARGSDALKCDKVPTAYVWYGEGDSETASEGARDLLTEAGFVVQNLPRDRSPWELRGMILLGSFASKDAAYADYMQRYGDALFNFVDKANLLVQLAQTSGTEPEPPFLPTTHGAQRGRASLDQLTLLTPGSALVQGAHTNATQLDWRGPGEVDAAFLSQAGFEVLIASDDAKKTAALMEGAYGQGRFVLSALPLDLPSERSAEADMFRRRLFQNLFAHTKNVCGRQTDALRVSSDGATGRFDPRSSMIAVLPDTQVYSLRNPGLFHAQTDWITDHAAEHDIRYAFHLGDIVNNNTDLEWSRASQAMAKLHGTVPYAIVPGNHDYGPSGDASTRDTLFNEYFDFETHAAMPGFAGAYEQGKLDNTYHLLSVGGHDYVVLALEWGPRDRVLAWANDIMDAHVEREGILITHAFLNNNNRRYDHTDKKHPQDYNPHEYKTPGGVNDGEEIWQKLVRKHRFVLTINGHVLGDGAGYRHDQTDLGTTCHQILANYQMRRLGGEGYMRLLELMPNGTTVRVWSYSVLYDDFLEDSEQQFSFELDP